MKTVWRVLGVLIGLVLIGYFAYFVHGTFDKAAFSRLATPAVIGAMLVAGLLYAMIIPISAWAWTKLLVREPGRWTVGELSGVMGVTQIAKYLPGNLAQHAGRTALALSRGMRLEDFFISVVVETVLAALSALMIGLIFLSVLPDGLRALPSWMREPLLWLLVALPVTLCLLLYAVGSGSRFVARLTGSLDLAARRRSVPRWSRQSLAFLAYTLNYLLIGLGFLLIARALGLNAGVGYIQLTAAFSLSWLAGFLTPGMPAGIGVREGVMALILGGAETDALGAIVAMRASTVGGDALWFLLGALILKLKKDSRRQ